jgi:hypothetical protein
MRVRTALVATWQVDRDDCNLHCFILVDTSSNRLQITFICFGQDGRTKSFFYFIGDIVGPFRAPAYTMIGIARQSLIGTGEAPVPAN